MVCGKRGDPSHPPSVAEKENGYQIVISTISNNPTFSTSTLQGREGAAHTTIHPNGSAVWDDGLIASRDRKKRRSNLLDRMTVIDGLTSGYSLGTLQWVVNGCFVNNDAAKVNNNEIEQGPLNVL